MKITEFKNFIREFPDLNQSFEIKKQNWKVKNQKENIDAIFDGNETIIINRFDLYNSTFNLKEFIIKTLMWGYPTKGRGNNIDNILKKENFENLIKILENYEEKEISIEQLKKDIKSISGLGLSTITKFTNFLNTRIKGNKAVILDIQIIEAINSGNFDELNSLKGIKYEKGINYYAEYLEIINKLSIKIDAKPDKIEMFLFMFGRNLSEIKGEECYDFD